LIKNDPTSNYKSIVNLTHHDNVDKALEEAIEQNQKNFSRRLQKSKIKDLERDARLLRDQNDRSKLKKIEEELEKAKKDVFTDERKIE
jgi:hypothetical protein